MAKRVYYEGKLEAAKSNIKHTWKILNEILNRSTKAHEVCSSFKIDNSDVSDPTEIANRFCDYFTNIGPNLAKNISLSLNAHRSYLTGNFANSIFLDLTNEQEVIELVYDLRMGAAAGYDNVPIAIVKDTIRLIAEPLAHIINLSIQSGIVPKKIEDSTSDPHI